MSQFVTDARDVAHAELDLVKARARDTIGRYKTAAIFFAVAGILALAALIALLVGLIEALAPQVGPGFATLIVVGVVLVIAAAAGLIGKARLSPRAAAR